MQTNKAIMLHISIYLFFAHELLKKCFRSYDLAHVQMLVFKFSGLQHVEICSNSEFTKNKHLSITDSEYLMLF